MISEEFDEDIKYIEECLKELDEQGVDYDNKALFDREIGIDDFDFVQENTVYNKEALMSILGWGDTKTTKFLRILFANGYATRVGNSYAITAKKLDEFLELCRGRELKLPDEFYAQKKYVEEKLKERKRCK